MLASLTRSNASTGPDRLRSIRSHLILGLLLPYVCLMGVCSVVLFAGPADTNRLPAMLVLIGAAVLLPAAMARIARSILVQLEALDTERATLAAGQVSRDARASAADQASAEWSAGKAPAIEAGTTNETEVAAKASGPPEAAGAVEAARTATSDLTNDIDEDAPVSAAVGTLQPEAATAIDEVPAETSDPVAVDLDTLLAAAIAARAEAAESPEPEAVDEAAPIAAATTAADEPVDTLEPAAVDLDALLATVAAARGEPARTSEPETIDVEPPVIAAAADEEAELPQEAADDEPGLSTGPAAVNADAVLAAAAALPEPEAEAGNSAPVPEADPRPMLVPSTIRGHVPTDPQAEPVPRTPRRARRAPANAPLA